MLVRLLAVLMAALSAIFAGTPPLHHSVARNGAFAAPVCQVGTDPAGDAPYTIEGQAVPTFTNADSLDVLSFGMGDDGTTLTGVIKVASLNSGPGSTPFIYGTADFWYMKFDLIDPVSGKTTHTDLLWATYGAWEQNDQSTTPPTVAAPLSFGYGEITTLASGNKQYGGNGGLATGSLDKAKGLITIQAPIKKMPGNPPKGTLFSNVGIETDAQTGFLNPSDTTSAPDNLDAGYTYTLGHHC